MAVTQKWIALMLVPLFCVGCHRNPSTAEEQAAVLSEEEAAVSSPAMMPGADGSGLRKGADSKGTDSKGNGSQGTGRQGTGSSHGHGGDRDVSALKGSVQGRGDPAPTAPPAAESAPRVQCRGFAYVITPDPNGLAVRSAPDGRAAVSAILPTGVPVDVAVVAAEGAWLQIIRAQSEEGDELAEPGWVSASLLGTRAQSRGGEGTVPLYVAPAIDRAIAIEIPSQETVPLAGCQDTWVQVTYQGTTGWLAPENQCGTVLTTCP
jgi:SH3-like domain-containing protein